MVCRLIGGATHAIRQGSETPFVHGRMKIPNASLEAIELNPRCSGQVSSKGPRTSPGNENMGYECAFRIPRSPYIARPLSHANAPLRLSHLIVSVQQAQMGVWSSVSPGAHLLTQLAVSVKYGLGPGCHAWLKRFFYEQCINFFLKANYKLLVKK